MKRAWFDKHKIGCINFSCEFHNVDNVKKVTLQIRIEY